VNADLSVAPEIAQLAAPVAAPQPALSGPPTAGRLAGEIARLAAAPQRWWDLVRFDPDAPCRIEVPGAPGDVWLLVLPPGTVASCDCSHATLLAGEAREDGRALRTGRVLVHGRLAPHRVLGSAHGYSVSMHLK
jgi:hypothetical protein